MRGYLVILVAVASLTKPITASTVLVSERAGRLNRTDKISRFLAYAEPAPTLDEPWSVVKYFKTSVFWMNANDIVRP